MYTNQVEQSKSHVGETNPTPELEHFLNELRNALDTLGMNISSVGSSLSRIKPFPPTPVSTEKQSVMLESNSLMDNLWNEYKRVTILNEALSQSKALARYIAGY